MKNKIIVFLISMLLLTMVTAPLVGSLTIRKETDQMAGVLDQSQMLHPDLYFLQGGVKHYQQFVPEGKTQVYVDVHMVQYFGGSPDITLSIEGPLNTVHTSATKQAPDIPSGTPDWVRFDFPDVSITPGNVYYIVLFAQPGGEYAWSGALGDPYPEGASSHPAPDWDFTFQTVVDKTLSKDDLKPEVMQGLIDQQQLLTTQPDWLPGGVMNWQEFENQGQTLESVNLHFGCYYGGSYPVTLAIQGPLGNNLTHVTHIASDFTLNTMTWFNFDFPDVKLQRGQKYYMVIFFSPGSEYAWSGAFGDPYTPGTSSKDPDWDYAFQTIVDKSKTKTDLSLSPGVVDQTQLLTTQIDWLEGGVPHWQEFKNRGNILEDVKLHFGCYFGGSYDVTLTIEKPLGNVLTTVTYSASYFTPSDTMNWFTFDFPDINVDKGQIYYMVINFAPGSEYAWSGAFGDPYGSGTSSKDPMWDYAFQTFVDQSKTGINPRTILSPGIIDQKQEDTSNLQWLQGGVDHWQQFINQGNIIEEVQVHMGQYYTGSADITLSIEATVGATPMTLATLTAADLPDNHQDWVTFDVIDVELNKGQMYYIVIYFDIGSEYAWSGSNKNPYPTYSSSIGGNWDYAFRTIVDKSLSKQIGQLGITNDLIKQLNENQLIYQVLQKIFA